VGWVVVRGWDGVGFGEFSWEFWGNFLENSGNFLGILGKFPGKFWKFPGNFRLGPGTKIDILK